MTAVTAKTIGAPVGHNWVLITYTNTLLKPISPLHMSPLCLSPLHFYLLYISTSSRMIFLLLARRPKCQPSLSCNSKHFVALKLSSTASARISLHIHIYKGGCHFCRRFRYALLHVPDNYPSYQML